MSKIITVKGVGQPNKVVLWEKDKAHPGGEVFLSTGDVAQVARTPAVEERLRKGTLVKVSAQAEDSGDTEDDGEDAEDDTEEGESKPEIGASTILTAATGPVANAVAGPEIGVGVGPARSRTVTKK